MLNTDMNKWALLHGTALKPNLLKDEKDRVFGCMIGTGIDGDGNAVTASSFAGLNSKGRTFETDFDAFVASIAGRYIIILDTGSKTRIYRDPMGHMPLFYNAKTGLAGSSVYLTLYQPASTNPACARPGETLLTTASVFPMGQTVDEDVRLLPGHHVLELADLSAKRAWPLRNTVRKVTASKSAPVVAKLAARLREIVQGWIDSDDVVLPVDASAGSRLLLAAAGDRRDKIVQAPCLKIDEGDTEKTAIAQRLADAAGIKLSILTKNEANTVFGRARALRHERKRLYWLRTSSAIRVPAEITTNVIGLQPEQHILLTGAGLDALQGGWQVGQSAAKAIRSGLTPEITCALATKPEKSVMTAVSGDYDAWKDSLPKTLHNQVEDFIRMELHQSAQAVATLGLADHVPASPFSDKQIIELALKLPYSFRSGEKFVEALIEELDPKLAGLPYVQELAPVDAAE
jgi:asparagine synthetase B (glutamine-hydrolysing)